MDGIAGGEHATVYEFCRVDRFTYKLYPDNSGGIIGRTPPLILYIAAKEQNGEYKFIYALPFLKKRAFYIATLNKQNSILFSRHFSR